MQLLLLICELFSNKTRSSHKPVSLYLLKKAYFNNCHSICFLSISFSFGNLLSVLRHAASDYPFSIFDLSPKIWSTDLTNDITSILSWQPFMVRYEQNVCIPILSYQLELMRYKLKLWECMHFLCVLLQLYSFVLNTFSTFIINLLI